MKEEIIDEHNRLMRLRDGLRNGNINPKDVPPEDLRRIREMEAEEEFH